MAWLGRAGLLLFGLALSVLLLEGGLQLASWFVRSSADRPLPTLPGQDRVRVLCLGDSNTYGLHLERHQAYPKQLETLWNQTVEEPRLEVVNLGYPGANSSRVERNLDQSLEDFAPDLVLLMVGVNDYWTRSVEVQEGVRPPFWKRHSRLYRLYLTLGRAKELPEVEFDISSEKGVPGIRTNRMRVGDTEYDASFEPRSETAGSGRQDGAGLLRLIGRVQDHGIPLHVMTYPAHKQLYHQANRMIRRVAASTRTPLVDLAADFETLCPAQDCPGLLFPDQHPTEAGYRRVAEAVLRHLAQRPVLSDTRGVPPS